ncbi:carbohydrate ABC transporter permease [Ruminiclostridium cellobioparum]|jgi:putative aldouronate transport system permease protein|uniref:ABC-type sugar transport system, permease component n=1 Tax=Ruminiclostridium cellobioparum subsp. termitidis CT1112 TaxID=1195236 RepID=S0FN26_RUMCE|nr:carbohydrate ABC transporter permease [Ruminiclostridium cellobioparum]EMS70534.1 ABC-type sugar transport system, permease component [Ruminiclostridium cellobioparum subsp. termitidis CT1112]
MVQSKTLGSKIFKVFLYILMAVLTLSCLYPIWYAFCLSISSKVASNSGMVTLYPVGFSLRSYTEIMGDWKFFHSFWVSIQRAGLGTVVSMLVMILMGYPLSKTKEQYKPRNILMWVVIFCMVFNGGTIPWYMTMVNYKMIDNIWGLVLCGGLPVFNLILIMNFFRNLPQDLEEAAVVDGAGPWKILFGIVVPCSKPVLATIVLFTSVGYWNEFFQGLVLSSGDKHYPLQTYIQQMVVNVQAASMSPDQAKLMNELSNKSLDAAKVFIAMIPMLVVYPFLQKYFVTGIMLGAVKE